MIYLLDTNVLSEGVRPEPDSRVLSLIVARQYDCATSATAWEEFIVGIELLPASARRKRLDAYRWQLLESGLEILPFDQTAAEWMADERARLIGSGRTPAYRDLQIAAVAATCNLTLVTRNVADFKPFKGLRVENWFRE